MKPYTASEVQGPGRRFWFRNAQQRDTFASAKRRAGYAVFTEGRTCWSSFGKRRTTPVDMVTRGGIDPLGMTRGGR